MPDRPDIELPSDRRSRRARRVVARVMAAGCVVSAAACGVRGALILRSADTERAHTIAYLMFALAVVLLLASVALLAVYPKQPGDGS